MTDGPNLLSTRGACTTIGRSGAEVQIRIVCDSEDEAKNIIESFRDDIRKTGKAMMVFGGTLDEDASAGRRN
jgi:hypothetical protein